MDQELPLKIILENPPAGVDFGIQKGSGNNYETIQKQRSIGGDLQFEFKIRLKKGTDPLPDFSGVYVQGKSGDRFIYIDIGTYAGQHDSVWSRRLKIPLRGITQEIINILSAGSDSILETKVAGTGKDGGPNCATVKPFNGWKIGPR